MQVDALLNGSSELEVVFTKVKGHATALDVSAGKSRKKTRMGTMALNVPIRTEFPLELSSFTWVL